MWREARYVSCTDADECFSVPCNNALGTDFGCDMNPYEQFQYLAIVLSLGLGITSVIAGIILFPIFFCIYVTSCDSRNSSIIFGLMGGGIASGVLFAGTLSLTFAALIVSVRILCSSLIYTVRNIPYVTSWCRRSLLDTASYAVSKLANCCSRLSRLAEFSGRNEEETDIESGSTEQLSEITTSLRQSESSEDANQTEQSQTQLSRRPSFASLMNPFSIFYRSVQASSETMPQGRRLSFTNWAPFSFFRASREEADLENGAPVESKTDMPEDMPSLLMIASGV